MGLFKRIADWERRLRASYNTDLSTPENRRRAHIYNLWFDHAILRKIWTNFFKVAPGVYRSNQPTHARFAKMKRMGIKTILNLRGSVPAAPYLTEEESCRSLGLTLVNVTLHARSAAPRQDIQAVIRAFREIEKPFVLHCKSGADRTGLASAIYLMAVEGRPVSEARRMLGVKFIHFSWTRSGILDHILDLYEARNARNPISFEDWIATEYDNKETQESFDAKRRS